MLFSYIVLLNLKQWPLWSTEDPILFKKDYFLTLTVMSASSGPTILRISLSVSFWKSMMVFCRMYCLVPSRESSPLIPCNVLLSRSRNKNINKLMATMFPMLGWWSRITVHVISTTYMGVVVAQWLGSWTINQKTVSLISTSGKLPLCSPWARPLNP